MAKDKSKVVGLKIEHSRKEDSPQNLAIILADSLQEEMTARTDAKEFRAQAIRERRKAQEFSGILIMLNEYQRKKKKALADGEDWKPSRMEPMESYDEDMIRKERMTLVARGQSLDEKANDYEKIADKAKLTSANIQQKLMSASKV